MNTVASKKPFAQLTRALYRAIFFLLMFGLTLGYLRTGYGTKLGLYSFGPDLVNYAIVFTFSTLSAWTIWAWRYPFASWKDAFQSSNQIVTCVVILYAVLFAFLAMGLRFSVE